MIWEENLVLSHLPYALDPGTYRYHRPDPEVNRWLVTFRAMWFRGVRGGPRVTTGLVRSSVTEPPVSWEHAAQLLNLAYYGGAAEARWDGTTMWAPGLPYAEVRERQLEMADMLDKFPEVPQGYSGWWRSTR